MPRLAQRFTLILVYLLRAGYSVFPFRAILYVSLAMYSTAGYAENNVTDSLRADSLKKILQAQKEDTNKVNTLNGLSRNLVTRDPESALQYANNALLLAEKIDFREGKGKTLSLIASIYGGQKNYPASLVNN